MESGTACIKIFIKLNDFLRIVQVDLKFPPKPIVSSAAKDLISQVYSFTWTTPSYIFT